MLKITSAYVTASLNNLWIKQPQLQSGNFHVHLEDWVMNDAVKGAQEIQVAPGDTIIVLLASLWLLYK
jgi:hypothetical protein